MKSQRTIRSRGAMVLFLVAVAPLFLYRPFISLPLFYDDLLHIRIVKSLDLVTVWLPTDAFSFYRPLTFMPLLLIKAVFGYYPNTVLHGLSVGLHTASALLLATLAWRLWGRWTRSLASGLLFGFFPFTYQTIGNSSPNAHLTMVFFLLLGLHAYLTFTERGGGRWMMAAFICFVLALLSHESAVLFGIFAALVHLNREGRWFCLSALLSREIRPGDWFRANPWVGFVVLGGLYVLIHRQLPLAPPPQNGDSPYQWSEGALYVIQAVAYPLAWFHRWLPDGAGEALVTGAFVGVLLATGLLAALRRSHLPALILGWGWWGLAALLLVLSLPPGYLLHGARLLYLSSIGVALLWAVWLDALYQTPKIGKVAGTLVLTFILVTSAIFVRARLDHYAQMARPVIFAREVMTGRLADEGVLFVNLPEWLNPDENTYPIGIEFVTLMGSYLFVEELVWENFPQPHPSLATHWHEPTGVLGYGYGFHRQTRIEDVVSDWAPVGSQIFVTKVTPGQVITRHAGEFRPLPGDETLQPLAQLGPVQILDVRAMQCGDVVESTISLRWEAGKLSIPMVLRLAVLDDTGGVLAEVVDTPASLSADRIELRPNWQLMDRRDIPVGDGNVARLSIRGYAMAVSEPYSAETVLGNELPGGLVMVALEPCER